MKKLIEKIREMKGVVTVEPAGEDMAVVVFEPKDERELRKFLKEIMVQHTGIVDDINPMSEDTARRLLGMFSKKTLKAEDLVDGEIYVMQAGNTHIFRAYTLGPDDHGFSCHYSYLCGDTFFSSGSICIESNDRICRKATTSEKQTLIKEEVKNGYFHELNKK